MRTVLWLTLPIGFLAVTAVVLFRSVLVREEGRRWVFPVLRPLYKRLNPSNVRAAESGRSRWGVIHHVGRRSGARYDTPIDAQRTDDGVIICLVYGARADWCRNVLAAGECTLTLDGKRLSLTAPEVITLDAAEPRLSAERARFWRRIGIEHCLSLELR